MKEKNLLLKNNLLLTKSRFQQIEERIRLILFEVFFVLLKSSDSSYAFEVIMRVFEVMQFMSFTFIGRVKE